MPRYSITIAFNADRTLSEGELNTIANACLAVEPVDADGEDLNVSVTDTEFFTMKIKE